MHLQDLLSSDTLLTLAGALAAAIWTVVQSTTWYACFKQNRFVRALTILEAGIEETYRTYVQALKAARADGKLTAEEKQEARTRARDRALELARAEGVDLIRELGPAFIELYLSKLVGKMKSSAAS